MRNLTSLKIISSKIIQPKPHLFYFDSLVGQGNIGQLTNYMVWSKAFFGIVFEIFSTMARCIYQKLMVSVSAGFPAVLELAEFVQMANTLMFVIYTNSGDSKIAGNPAESGDFSPNFIQRIMSRKSTSFFNVSDHNSSMRLTSKFNNCEEHVSTENFRCWLPKFNLPVDIC